MHTDARKAHLLDMSVSNVSPVARRAWTGAAVGIFPAVSTSSEKISVD